MTPRYVTCSCGFSQQVTMASTLRRVAGTHRRTCPGTIAIKKER
jgi:hypothetical protein